MNHFINKLSVTIFIILVVSLVPLSYAEHDYIKFEDMASITSAQLDALKSVNTSMYNDRYGWAIDTRTGLFYFTIDFEKSWILAPNLTYSDITVTKQVYFSIDALILDFTIDSNSQITIHVMGVGGHYDDLVVLTTGIGASVILDGKPLECGIDIQEINLAYGEIDVRTISKEIELPITNIGILNATVTISGTDWLDADSNSVMNSFQTRSSQDSVDYENKIPLDSSMSSSSTVLTLKSYDTLLTYWQVLPILNEGQESFTGELTQTLTFSVNCDE